MKQIKIADTTLCAEKGVFGFKEKLEIARQLERLEVDVIEIPEIQNAKVDCLFVRTASSFVKNSIISVAAGSSEESVKLAVEALSSAQHGRVRIELPVSPVGMEYIAHKKAAAMPDYITKLIGIAKESVSEVEFCAVDATRTEKEFLMQLIDAAVAAGATHISICDSAAEILPDDFAAFIAEIAEKVSLPIGVACNNKNGLAAASAILAVRKGADCIKTDIGGNQAPLVDIADMIKNCGNNYQYTASLKQTELYRIVKQISWITSNAKNEKAAMTVAAGEENEVYLDVNDDQAAVDMAVAKLGYDLSEEDQKMV